ncbi:flagellar protein FlaG [Guyparkeria sp. TX1]|uniref:flagellar protein FlaG n=1 Tax=Guyparkeria sp. TX1 TaxID=3115001 RepID=UPI003977CA73
MSSINQISMTGIPSAMSGPDAFLSSERGKSTLMESKVPTAAPAELPPKPSSAPSPVEVARSKGADAQADGERDKLREAIEAIQEKLKPGPRALDFSVNDKLGDVVVKVVDPSNKQVIREIPPEEIIAMRERLREFSELNLSDVLPAGSLLSDIS